MSEVVPVWTPKLKTMSATYKQVAIFILLRKSYNSAHVLFNFLIIDCNSWCSKYLPENVATQQAVAIPPFSRDQ